MAKRRRARRNSNFFVQKIDAVRTLLTLATGGLVTTPLTTFGVVRVKVIGADLKWSLTDLTTNEVPIEVGVCSGDLSDTEVQEALDASPTSKADIIANERLRRPVRSSGEFGEPDSHQQLNDGKAIRNRKLYWDLDEGVEIDMYARNLSGSTLTTGASVRVSGKLYCIWK